MKLTPIAPEKQIENVLFGVSEKEKNTVQEKAIYVRNNIHKIVKINGKKVFNVMMNDINNDSIYYNLREKNCDNNIQSERKYYYPIQYAEIEIH